MTLRITYHAAFWFSFWPLFGSAQVTIDHSIRTTGSTPADRQVTGLKEPTSAGELQTARLEQAGTFRTVEPLAGTIWAVPLPVLSVEPRTGTHFVMKAPTPTSGPISITVNGYGPYPLVDNALVPMDGSDVAVGTMLSVVFDGSAMQVMNGTAYGRLPCPNGTVAVNEQFCIEPTQRPVSDLYQAMLACGAEGKRMCSWGEFYAACQNATALGLVAMTNDWEWIPDASNELNSARVVGQGSCGAAGNSIVTGNIDRAFRCCWSR